MTQRKLKLDIASCAAHATNPSYGNICCDHTAAAITRALSVRRDVGSPARVASASWLLRYRADDSAGAVSKRERDRAREALHAAALLYAREVNP